MKQCTLLLLGRLLFILALFLVQLKGNSGINYNEDVNASPVQIERRLVIVTCETRLEGENVLDFSEFWNKTSVPLRNARIPIINACLGEDWKEYRYFTKPVMYRRIANFLFQFYQSSATTDSMIDLHLLLVDSDTFWTVSRVDEIWTAYDFARGEKDLVVSSETTCWIGDYCSESYVQKYYADISNPEKYSTGSMSAFVNSGVIMGKLPSVLRLLEYVVSHQHSYFLGDWGMDDQLAVTDYSRSVAPNEVALDVHQFLSGSCLHTLPTDPPDSRTGLVCLTPDRQVSYNCFMIGPSILDMNYYRFDASTCRVQRVYEVWESLGVIDWQFIGLAASPVIWHAHGEQ